MKKPLITIITNTKNRSKLIHRCIESIQRQTYQNYEHIIADGGTDNTEEVVKTYNDPHIKYVKILSGGPVAQTYEAFKISEGNYITFLDDDDEYLPEKLEKQIELIESLPEDYGFIYGSMTYYDYNTNEKLRVHEANIEGGDLLNIAVSNPIICGTPTLMFRREIFESIGGTWIKGIGNEMSDWALVCKALKQGWKIGALKESYLKIYVNHGSQRMSDPVFSKKTAEKYILFHSYFLNEYAEIFNATPKAAETHYRGLFTNYFLASDWNNGFKYWFKLLRINFKLKYVAMLPYYIYRSL